MSTIVTRAGKGSPLTNNEMDANLNNLNADKIEAATTVALTNKTIVVASNTVTTAASGALAATELNAALAELEAEKVAISGGTMTGTLKNTASQIGTSGTATNNFSLEPTTAGAMKLARGDAGATTQDLITVSATNIITGGSGATLVGNGPAFSVVKNATQAIGSGASTKVTFQTREFDTNFMFDITTNSRFQPTIGGYYQFTGRVNIGSGSAMTDVVSMIYKNGSPYKIGNRPTSSGMNIPTNGVTVDALVFLNGSTDYVELWVNCTASSPVIGSGPVETYLQGFLARSA